MEERLMRNEIHCLTKNLHVMSEQLITLHEFIQKEFGSRFVSFCQARRDDGDEDKNQRVQTLSSTYDPAQKSGSGSVDSRNKLSVSPITTACPTKSLRALSTTGDDTPSPAKRVKTSINIESVVILPSIDFGHIHDESNADPLGVQDEDCIEGGNEVNSEHLVGFQSMCRTEEGSNVRFHEEDDTNQYSTIRQAESSNIYSDSEGQRDHSMTLGKHLPISSFKFTKTTSIRGGRPVRGIETLEGYVFQINCVQENRNYYVCNQRKRGCKARLAFNTDEGTVLQNVGHIHKPKEQPSERIPDHDLIGTSNNSVPDSVPQAYRHLYQIQSDDSNSDEVLTNLASSVSRCYTKPVKKTKPLSCRQDFKPEDDGVIGSGSKNSASLNDDDVDIKVEII